MFPELWLLFQRNHESSCLSPKSQEVLHWHWSRCSSVLFLLTDHSWRITRKTHELEVLDQLLHWILNKVLLLWMHFQSHLLFWCSLSRDLLQPSSPTDLHFQMFRQRKDDYEQTLLWLWLFFLILTLLSLSQILCDQFLLLQLLFVLLAANLHLSWEWKSSVLTVFLIRELSMFLICVSHALKTCTKDKRYPCSLRMVAECRSIHHKVKSLYNL